MLEIQVKFNDAIYKWNHNFVSLGFCKYPKRCTICGARVAMFERGSQNFFVNPTSRRTALSQMLVAPLSPNKN